MVIFFSILLLTLIGVWTFFGLYIFMQCCDANNSDKATLKLICISPLFGPLALIGGIGIFIGFLNNKKVIERFSNGIAEKIINWINK